MAQFINVQKKSSDVLVYCSAGLLFIFFTFGVLAPWIAPYDLEQMDLGSRLTMPFTSFAHILGTDELGRDVFSIILALTILAFLGTNVTVIVVIMAVYGWDRYARLTRNLARSAYTEGYANALEGLGIPTWRIAIRHILPNIASALVVNMTLNFPGMILLETSLSFLGVGVQPPMSSLGTMLGFGRDYLTTAWWIAVIPGVVIVLSTLSMSILGDFVQQKLEPQGR